MAEEREIHGIEKGKNVFRVGRGENKKPLVLMEKLIPEDVVELKQQNG